VRARVCAPAGLTDTEFPRSDEPSGRLALGYLGNGGLRTNVLHLPVVGSGDGGMCSTARDVHALWHAILGGRVVPADGVARMLRPHSEWAANGTSYGLGVWLHRRGAVALEGADAGVSFRSVHSPAAGVVHTVLANTTDGAWPLARLLHESLTA
jgi:CubicO group peptidase (beta-lactamase class C family)